MKTNAGIYKTDNNFHSDFGTSASSQEQIWEYMVQRIAIFFQAALNNATPSDFHNSKGDHNIFVECENYRNGCDYSPDNDGCADDDDCSGRTFNE